MLFAYRRTFYVIAVLALLVSGCGKKGPLYLPVPPPPAEPKQSTP